MSIFTSLFKPFHGWSAPTAILLFATLLPAWPQTPPQITEFMAANEAILADEDGEYSDWIEIYNPSITAVNLGGWYLTDNAGHLAKWAFPETNLAAYSYLVVFASGKDRTNAGAPLHTNFRLDADGEFLALMRPDGTNAVSYYTPRFPAQKLDVSYGLPMMPGPSTFLVDTGAAARVFVPTSDIGAAWTGTTFDDAGWLSAAVGVGFDGGTNYDPGIATDIQAAMLGVNPSAYIRVPFQVTDPEEFQELTLRLRYDDGFVAYLNGTEVARNNVPAAVAWNSAALDYHGSEPGVFAKVEADFDTVTNAYTSSHFSSSTVATPSAAITAGDSGSTGRFLRLTHDVPEYEHNAIAFDRTAVGVYPRIAAEFDFRITDVNASPADGFAFMLIPTSTYGASGMGACRAYSGIEEPAFAGVFAIGFDVYPHGDGVNDVSIYWNGTEITQGRIPRTTLELVTGTFHRCSALIEYVTGGARVTVTIHPNVNGAGGTPFTVANRLFIGMPQYESRVEFAGRTGGLNMAIDLDNIDVGYGFPTGMVPAEDFDLSSHVTLLQPGQNMLAIHGLNLAATNVDFLVSPQLLARPITLITTSAVYQAEATPGSVNIPGDEYLAPPVEFSLPGGVYTNDSIAVALSSPVSNAVIRYTSNGTTPTEESTLYTGTPIHVAGSVRIVAKAWATGYTPSVPVSEGYTLLDPGALSFSSALPLVIVDTFGATISQDMTPRAPATITIIDTTSPTGTARLTDRVDVQRRIQIEGRGQTSWGFNKKPFNVEFVDEYGRDRKASFLNFPSGSDFVLLNVWNDKTFLCDYLAFVLHEEMGHYSMRRRFVEVFFNGPYPGTVSGTAPTAGKVGTNDYAGVYVLLEKPRIDANRVDIAKLQPEDNAEPEVTGGYIWKKDKNSPGDLNFALPQQPINAGDAMKFHDPTPTQITPAQIAWLTNYLTEFENVLYSANWRDPVNGYPKYVDVDSFVDNHWIVEFTKQIDGYRLSNYMYKDRGGKINMEPIWDWNLSFGNANYLEGGLTNGWYYPLISEQQHIWLRRLIAGPSGGSRPGDPDFLQAITDRWGELRTNVFEVDKVIAQVESMTNYLYEAALRDLARFPRLKGQAGAPNQSHGYLWPNPDGANTVASGTDGTSATWHIDYCSPTTYPGIIAEMKKWIRGRYAWIDSLFLRAPTFSRNSGFPDIPLNMYAVAGTVYYTTDGSDPRLSGGAISPLAQPYSGPITLPPDARIVARCHSTATNYWTAWSPPTCAAFGDPVPALAITEVMYHPEPGAGFADEDFEYIEFTNTGTNTLDLTGMRLTGGVEFTFPSGPLEPTGTVTTNDFDGHGTAYTAALLGAGSGATVTAGGPAGSFLRLAAQDTGTNRNRIAFDQTATGRYDIVTADFDFRASNATPPPAAGTPTVQDFDNPGTAYALRSYDTTVPGTPVVAGPDAGSTGKFARLTQESESENGGIFFDATAAGTNRQVIINFDFRMTATGTPADGIGFVYLNTANHGTTGATSGSWSEDPNVVGSIGIGFDNYFNSPATANEPNDNFVSLHWNSAQVSGAAVSPTFRLVAGVFHRATIVLKFEGTRALVTVKLTPNIHGAVGPTETLYSDYVINGVSPYRGRAAICARTGGAWAYQDVDNFDIQYFAQLIPPAGGLSLALLPSDTFGASGAGTDTGDYLDLPNVAGVFALDLGMHSSPLVNDVTLHWNGAARSSAFVPPATLDLDSGSFHHAHLELVRGAEGSAATLVLTPNIFGTPGTPVTVLDGAFLSGFFPEDARVEFAARSGGMNLGVDLENVLVACHKYAPNLLAAGESILVVSSNAAFQTRYGTGPLVAGEFTGHLDNGGECLRLFGPQGEPILDFRYNDAWYPMTDGNGYALVFPNPQLPSASWDDPVFWQAGTVLGGSPGQPDPPPTTFVPVLVTEVLSNPDPGQVYDAVELHNPSGTPADISGWYLSDNFSVPKKYRLPEGTLLPGGAYLVIGESAFNDPASPTRFAFRSEGDDVYVFSANPAGDLTGYFHGIDFGAAETGVSFGRHVTSVGEAHTVAQAAVTLGTNNAGPKVGPVVISEIMYRPPDYVGGIDNAEDEYIELHNITDSDVPLWDAAHPTNTWALRDAVDFQFPVNTTIPARGYALVVNFDPVLDRDQLAAFRILYGIDPSVPLFGPYGGKLDNSGESVELTKPSEPDPDTLKPDAIVVDKVKYADAAPWPAAADGRGLSLQRIAVDAYGNDPANWLAAETTAGTANTGTLPPTIATQPQSLAVAEMASASFSIVMSGTGPFDYQWLMNGDPIPDATGPILLLSDVRAADAGAYSVLVFRGDTAVLSSNAVLTVYPAPVILTQPQSYITNAGVTVTFSVTAMGNGELTYQWLRNGAIVPDATNASHTVVNAQFNVNDGQYNVLVTDAIGSCLSQPGYLNTKTRPGILVNLAVTPGTNILEGRTFTLSITATGSFPMGFRFRSPRDQYFAILTCYSNISTATLVVDNAKSNLHTGGWDVGITNSGGSLLSKKVYLTVTPAAPYFAVHPASQEAAVGDDLLLASEARGTDPIAYQWFLNGTTPIPDATNATLAVSDIQAAAFGDYVAVASNHLGIATSEVAQVT
ncbi:MAG: lamin tail domain-containing protein, partial [Verrucomicrobia bacterium]|nr:lamin tail domain-containing protein [Verrucomicrobiota bacterium]